MNAGIVTTLRVMLTIDQPWAVGGVTAPGDTIDLPVQRDPRPGGGVHLPASSLTGALREHLGPEHGPRLLGAGLGARELRGSNRTPTPSLVRVLGTVVAGTCLSGSASTAVDGRRRAAKPGSLRTEQRVEGVDGRTRVRWYLEHAGARDAVLMKALQEWAPVIGRRRTSGQGQATVRTIDWVEADLGTDDGLTWWLGSRGAWFGGGPLPDPTGGVSSGTMRGTAPSPTMPVLEARLVVVDPLHVGADHRATTRGAAGVAAPQDVRLNSNGMPIIPGTSWKGVFRHRIEHVLDAVGAAAEDRDAVTAALFGEPTVDAGRGADGRDTVSGGRGCLRFSESSLTGKPLVTRSHVAIDRVSGGARDSLLFAWRAVPRGATADLMVATTRPLPTAVSALLDHVLQDLHDGLIGVGGGTSRGYGTVRLDPAPARPGALDVDAITSWAREAATAEEPS